MILHQMHDAVQAPVHRAAVVFFITKVHPSGLFLIIRNMHRMVHQFVHTLVFCRGNRHYRNP